MAPGVLVERRVARSSLDDKPRARKGLPLVRCCAVHDSPDYTDSEKRWQVNLICRSNGPTAVGPADEAGAQSESGPVTDEITRRYITGLLGDEFVDTASRTVRRGGGEASVTVGSTKRAKASAAALQQLGGDRAMVVEGDHPPAVVALRPYWKEWPVRSTDARGLPH
jgi:hypothetical protein